MNLMKIPKVFSSLFRPETPLSTICNIYGIILALTATGIRCCSSSIVHAFPNVSSVHVLSIESIIAFLGICFVIDLESIKTHIFRWQSVKALCNVVGTLILFEGLKKIPLFVNSVLSLSSILFSVLGSVILFKEKMTLGLFWALALSCLGVLSLSNFDNISKIWLYPLSAAFLFSISSLISKKIALFDSLKTSLFWTFFLQIFMLVIPSTQGNFTQNSIICGVSIGLLTLVSLALSLQAETFAAMPFLAPFKCIRILFSGLLGLCLFHETISISMLFGGFCLVFSCFLLSRNKASVSSHYLENLGKDVIQK